MFLRTYVFSIPLLLLSLQPKGASIWIRICSLDANTRFISSWHGASETGKAQIDLIIDRRDRTINICEIKFSVAEFVIGQDYEKILQKKMQVFREVSKSKKALQLVMITTYGVRQNSHSGIVQSQVLMDDLFA